MSILCAMLANKCIEHSSTVQYSILTLKSVPSNKNQLETIHRSSTLTYATGIFLSGLLKFLIKKKHQQFCRSVQEGCATTISTVEQLS